MIKEGRFIVEFVKRFNKDYKLNYVTDADDNILDDTIIEVECPEHGIFKGTYNELLEGYGCPECGVERLIKHYTVAKHLHKNKFLIESVFEEKDGEQILVKKNKTRVPIMLHTQKISDMPEAIRASFEYATNDPYVKTWDDWRRVFTCYFNSHNWHKEQEFENEETFVSTPKMSGCKNMREVRATVDKIKKIREAKQNR